jgi:predicted amidohydrolase
MRATVCQLQNESRPFVSDWDELVEHVRDSRSELVLLPQLAFSPYFLQRNFNFDAWRSAIEAQGTWEHRLHELAPAIVLGSRPIEFGNERYHEAYAWHPEDGIRSVHAQAFLPDSETAHDHSWFTDATPDFVPFDIGPLVLGFMFCSELSSRDEVSRYAAEHVHILATPRATTAAEHEKCFASARRTARHMGSYVISSNRIADDGSFNGAGWIVDPRGNVLAMTSRDRPFETLELDVGTLERGTTSPIAERPPEFDHRRL